MILSDFLTLESYFSHEESARFFEDISHRYGDRALRNAIAAGDLMCRVVRLGPDSGRLMVWLTDQGRKRAH